SLLDLGADLQAVRQAVESVGCRLEVSRQERSSIMACRAIVTSDKRFRSLSEAQSILQASSLKGSALENALRALHILAQAEGQVHGSAPDQPHFHEVGALDALADIAGACAARASLKAERVLCLPVSVGGGFVRSAHGLLPVPGPAALEILRSHSIPWRGGPTEEELLTPTGAALLAALADEFLLQAPLLKAERVGCGAGRKDLEMPNVLRSVLAELLPAGTTAPGHGQHGDSVVQLESNVDDVTGEVLGFLIERLMQEGALDVSILPALMKKGRAGSVIRAIARAGDGERLAGIIIRETGSLGVRVFPGIHRFLAEREETQVAVELDGEAHRSRIKVSRLDGAIISLKPEYEDCKRIAEATGLPLREVSQKVKEAGQKAFNTRHPL
ncbi:MAG: nickel pincer cofactor biosynthesis protein LarC, partial [Methanothrix sp.]|nr:nickel pincer cofactor biosynthesis protein LarC [Methanothrix sp.]